MVTYKSLVPKMTSDSYGGFVCSMTGSGNTGGYKVFDGDLNSSFRSSIMPTLPEYLTIKFPKSYRIARYAISLGNSYDMLTWDFEVFVNNEWKLIHSGSHVNGVKETITFDFTPIEVTSARIKCKTRYGTNSWGIDELVIFEYVTVTKTLISSDDGFYHIPFTINNNKDIVPSMTANNVPIGLVSSSSTTGGNYDWYVFDDNPTGNGWISAQSNITNQWLSYEFSKPRAIGKYTLTETYSTPCAPLDWRIEGSNDGGNTWDILDSRMNVTDWILGVKKEFYIDESKMYPYKIYRIFVLRNNGSPSYVSLGEIEFIEVKSEEYYLKSVNDTNIDKYGLDKVYEIDFNKKINKKIFVEETPTTLGNGKIFNKQVDTSKIKIKKIEIV